MVKENKTLDERLSLKVLPNGVKCYTVVKRNYRSKYVVVAFNFGGMYNKIRKGGKIKEIPYGAAHFLEHVMFNDKEINFMEEFSKNDALLNAYTNAQSTAYHFKSIDNSGYSTARANDKASDNFNNCLGLLLGMVSNLYLTDEGIEKEKKIITQEIKMYEEYPTWHVYTNMMRGMYFNKGFSANISGDVKDIGLIDRDILSEAYNSFYNTENMTIVCIGDIDEDCLLEHIENKLAESEFNENKLFEKSPKVKNNTQAQIVLDEEPDGIKESFIETQMDLGNNIFCLGFKDNSYNEDIVTNIVSSKILLDICFGESSAFFNNMYEKGLIDNSFNVDYNNFKFFGNSIFAGVSKDPKELSKYVLEEIGEVKIKGISDERFSIIKNKSIGRFIREFNVFENISNILLDLNTNDLDYIDIASCYENIDKCSVEARLAGLKEESSVLSVVRGK